jgi:hypothetical protein
MPSTISYTNTPNSSNIYEAKILAKTNMRLGNDGLVITNISRLLKNKIIK